VISPSHLSMMASDSDLMAFIFAPFSGITCALAINDDLLAFQSGKDADINVLDP